MAINRGTQFEEKFKEDWIKTVPDSFILRLPDQITYYSGSTNICDFLTYKHPELFLVECKTTHVGTFPFSNFPQYERMIKFKDVSGIRAGVVLWWIAHDTIAWIPIQSVEQMKKDKKKSINIKMIKEKVYDITLIPSVKKRVFFDSDYSVLLKKGDE